MPTIGQIVLFAFDFVRAFLRDEGRFFLGGLLTGMRLLLCLATPRDTRSNVVAGTYECNNKLLVSTNVAGCVAVSGPGHLPTAYQVLSRDL